MRVTASAEGVELDSQGEAELVLTVLNTSEIIDGLVVRPVGMPAEFIVGRPSVLALFPDSEGEVTVAFAVPATYPAGDHHIELEVASQRNLQEAQRVPLILSVPPRPELQVDTRPARIRARREGAFVLEILNSGNIPLDTSIRTVDAERTLTVATGTDRLWLEPGALAKVRLIVRGPRMIFGSELDRTLTIEATGRAISDAAELDTAATAMPVLRQKPTITRGMITAAILPAIIALWALVFLLGANRVFNQDPLTKSAPASFYASAVGTNGAAGGSPAGALPKDGQVPAGVGGTITGKVTAASDGSPVGRLQVDAYRRTVAGELVQISSGATQSDGSYSVAGLFPGTYLIKVSSTGFDTVWFPNSPTDAGAKAVSASAAKPTTDINIVITGQPASITGTVTLGATLNTTPVTVAVRTLTGTGATSAQTPIAQTTTAANGSYALTGLPAPSSYELTFTATGYQPTSLVESVNGGQARIEPAVQMSAGNGQISGLVTDGSSPLGGVTITTTVNGTTVTTGTPTTGAVGTYVLPGLPTPGTYLLTYSLTGYGSRTIVVDLSAGQSASGINVAIQGGTGTVTGRVIDSAGNGLGGVTVTVGGGSSSATTATLTSGSVGTFVLSGLPAPAAYTLTFSLPGYTSQTVPVTLNGSGAPPTVNVTLPTSTGSMIGLAKTCPPAPAGCAPVTGAAVSATNGQQTFTTTTTSAGTSIGNGGYTLTGLPPGTYAVTVSAAGFAQQTALAVVTSGTQTTVSELDLPVAS